MNISEVATRAGISRRTLHFYDKIGLLSPSSRTTSGYRLYIQDDLKILQQIFLKNWISA